MSTATAIHAKNGRLKFGKASASRIPEIKERRVRHFRESICESKGACTDKRPCSLRGSRSAVPIERRGSTPGDGFETLALKLLPGEIGGLRVCIGSDLHAIITVGAGRQHEGGEF